MQAFLTRALVILSALLIAAGVSAQTQGLERVGLTSPTNGFPTWYQDKTGLTLEFCQVTNQAELDGGWCLLLPADTTAPEAFPAPFADEHFFFAADALINAASGFSAKLVIGLEGAFAVGPVISGDQVVFARVRVVFDAPTTGTYTVLHPYGTELLEGVAGQRVFFTRDIGIACAGGGTAFECALRGDIGPFLLPSNSPGGLELPAVPGPVPGKLYISDPARIGPVTGSPVGQNLFRIFAPGGAVIGETTDFTLVGRIFQGAIPGRMTVDRARYALASGSATGKTDVFATAFATAQPRLPAAPWTGAIPPQLQFYPAACSVGAGGAMGAPAASTPVQMFSSGSHHYGQTEGAIPAAVCVQDLTARDANGQAISVYSQATVTDQVTISEALYNHVGGTLTVTATSSDLNIPPVLSALGVGSFTSGASVTGIVGVPPLMVTVTSAAGGRAELEVSTTVGQPTLPGVPLAGNDAFAVNEDSGANTVSVLANDTMNGAAIDPTTAIIAIVQQPALGSATVIGGAIVFTPGLNANGNDQLTYTVSAAGATSLPAFVSISITPVNDAPVANDDAPNGVGGLANAINLLANDTDIDGAADLVGVNIVSAPAGITYTLVGGVLNFTAPAGTHTFTYQARDVAGALSNVATVTVTLSGGETLVFVRQEYIQNKRRWRVEGTSSVLGAQTVYVMYADGVFADGTLAVGYLIGTAQVNPIGAWAIDFTLAGANDPRNPTSTLFSVRPTRIYAITTLGGSSPTATITLR